jgi:2-polyprenyl-3-methyl-5-hydroxy-6-metoxy-1,4-benzoquinol methylase
MKSANTKNSSGPQPAHEAEHAERQRGWADALYSEGPRVHVTTSDPLVQYLVTWRVRTVIRKLKEFCGDRFDLNSPVLLMCCGEGLEGSVLCDLGYRNVTVSDISSRGVDLATARDSRLTGIVLDAEQVSVAHGSYDLVLVQDGLHHLRSPVAGFTSMLAAARICAAFLEPHRSVVGRLFGTRWERNGDAVNWVFRWDKPLVEQIASSYLGPDAFDNLSFSFWHHNLVLERFCRVIGGRRGGVAVAGMVKATLDLAAGRFGNQFCGFVIKRDTSVRARVRT